MQDRMMLGLTAVVVSAFVSFPLLSETIEPQEPQVAPELGALLQPPSQLTLQPPASIPSDMHADPLFLEIQKMILNQGSNAAQTLPADSTPVSRAGDNASQGFSVQRWDAIESMLKAARLLELDARGQLENNQLDQAIKAKEAANRLREQCLQLLGR